MNHRLLGLGGVGKCFREKKAPCIGKLDSVEKLARTKERKKEQVKHGEVE